MFVTILLLIFIAFLVFNCYVQYGPNGQLINKIPGPCCYPIIGNTIKLINLGVLRIWKYIICTSSDKYYPIWKLRSFFESLVIIRHPDDMETILNNTKHINKSKLYDILHPWLGTGLLTSTDSKWHTRRKILTPTFHFNILQQFVEILIKEGECMTNSLKNTGGTITKDLEPFITEHTLNAICETAMGTSLQRTGLFQQKYREAIHQIMETLLYRAVRVWLHGWIFWLTPLGRKQIKLLKVMHGFTEKVIAERKDYYKRTNGQYLKNLNKDTIEDEAEIGVRKKRLAMLDLLIQTAQENHLSDLDIREEVDTFMFEGHDTTAMGITYTLALLAEHKDIQDGVRKEIDAIMEENQGKLTILSLQKLQYLDRCIKEALRLYPSVFTIMRTTSEETLLQSYVIPAGTMVLLNIYATHRDPSFWTNPEIFNPDRFLPEIIRNRHPYSYLPFSAGPRNCIGQRFAMLELKAMIAPLIHNFYLEPVDYLKNIEFKADMILRPLKPHRIKFVPIAKSI
ncbi:cytochrome P450 4C1 [Solenopsis invicta]|uniref:cytochrome P450 4C1 n=1 Tax=Solenopsis invicta TaxID=13686 RepID=UPI000595BC41|nr:cytochrome P450 4C1 [Solenopsis invicta]